MIFRLVTSCMTLAISRFPSGETMARMDVRSQTMPPPAAIRPCSNSTGPAAVSASRQ